VPKDEFLEVYLELGLTYAVVGADEPLLEVANGSIGKWNGGLRTFSQLPAERLDASDMFEASLNQTDETLEAVRIDGGARCKTFRVSTGIIVLALKSGITFMRARPDA
jgi:hypothetical protein